MPVELAIHIDRDCKKIYKKSLVSHHRNMYVGSTGVHVEEVGIFIKAAWSLYLCAWTKKKLDLKLNYEQNEEINSGETIQWVKRNGKNLNKEKRSPRV